MLPSQNSIRSALPAISHPSHPSIMTSAIRPVRMPFCTAPARKKCSVVIAPARRDTGRNSEPAPRAEAWSRRGPCERRRRDRIRWENPDSRQKQGADRGVVGRCQPIDASAKYREPVGATRTSTDAVLSRSDLRGQNKLDPPHVDVRHDAESGWPEHLLHLTRGYDAAHRIFLPTGTARQIKVLAPDIVAGRHTSSAGERRLHRRLR